MSLVSVCIRNIKALLLMVLCLGLSMAQAKMAQAENSMTGKRPPVILVVGDSISAGFGIPIQQGWVALLEQQLQQRVPKVGVINASVSGDTTQGGVARLPDLIQTHQPDLLIVELGGNDALRGTPLPLIEKNLATMISQAEQEGVMVMLLGMQIPPNYGPDYSQGFASLFAKLADQRATFLVPFLLDGIATKPGMMQADGIHPTAEAQPTMASAVVDALDIWIEFVTNQG